MSCLLLDSVHSEPQIPPVSCYVSRKKNNSKTQTGCLRYSEDIDGPSTVKPNISPRERTRVLSPGYSTETPKCPLVFELVNMGNYLQGNCIPDSTFSRTDSVSREHGHRTGIFFRGLFHASSSIRSAVEGAYDQKVPVGVSDTGRPVTRNDCEGRTCVTF